MKPGKAQALLSHWQGDNWEDGITAIGPITINGSRPNAPCQYARLQFYDADGALGYELNSEPAPGQGLLVIDDAVNYSFTRPAQALPLPEGTWLWSFQTFTTADHTDAPTTWVTGNMRVYAQGGE